MPFAGALECQVGILAVHSGKLADVLIEILEAARLAMQTARVTGGIELTTLLFGAENQQFFEFIGRQALRSVTLSQDTLNAVFVGGVDQVRDCFVTLSDARFCIYHVDGIGHGVPFMIN